MVLRINHNIAALNGHRAVVENGNNLRRSLEKLSTGMKINRAGDSPAGMIISSQMRAQIAGLNQAVDNAETAVTMVQTTEAALTEVTNILTKIRQLAIHAANEGANDKNMLEADQLELDNALFSLDRVAFNAQYGVKKLLDGSTGANGVGIGEGIDFIAASPDTGASPVEGYAIQVSRLGTQASVKGDVGLTEEIVNAGEEFTIAEGGKTVSFTTKEGMSVAQTLGLLRNEIKKIGLDLEMIDNEDGTLELVHNKYGSEFGFSVSSSTAGLLSKESRSMDAATPGQDIRGVIGGHVTTGFGQTLTGVDGTSIQGLEVRYKGDKVVDPEGDENSGRVAVYQNSLVFQVGGNVGQTVSVSLVNANTRVLGRGVDNKSEYSSIKDADLRSAQGAVDTQKLVDVAIDEVNTSRARLGAFQKNSLENNLRQLRVNVEELTNAESVIRDSDMAKEIAEFTRNKILMDTSVAMLGHANQIPNVVLSLLR